MPKSLNLHSTNIENVRTVVEFVADAIEFTIYAATAAPAHAHDATTGTVVPLSSLKMLFLYFQQVNSVPEKCNIIPVPMDPIRMLVQQMGMMRMQQNNVGVPGNVCPTANVQTEPLVNNFPGIQGSISATAMTPNNLGGLQARLGAASILPTSTLPAKPTIDDLGTPNDNNPIHNLLRQFQNKQSQSQQVINILLNVTIPHIGKNNVFGPISINIF